MRLSRQAVRRNPHRLGVSGFAGCQNLPVDKSARTVYIGHNASVKRTSAALMAVPLAASMLLAGCGGDAKPDASSSSTPTSSSTTTAATTTAPPTSASPTVDPNIPAAARAHTPAGAEAFVRYFYTQLNVAWGQPKSGLLAPLSLPSCKICTALEENAAKNVSTHQRMSGDTVRIDSADAGGTESTGDQRLIVIGSQLKSSVVDSNGRKVRDIPAAKFRFVATTRWTESGWRVNDIKVLK
jgi:hypothetical protein